MRQPGQKGFIKSGVPWKKAVIDSRVSRDLYDLRRSLRKRQITSRGQYHGTTNSHDQQMQHDLCRLNSIPNATREREKARVRKSFRSFCRAKRVPSNAGIAARIHGDSHATRRTLHHRGLATALYVSLLPLASYIS